MLFVCFVSMHQRTGWWGR